MAQSIFVIAEQRDGAFKKASYEAVSEARRIADGAGAQVIAAILGAGVESMAEQLGVYGADAVCVADDPALADYTSEAYVQALEKIVAEKSPELILIGATMQGKDLAARLAARLDAGLAMDCIQVQAEDGRTVFTRPVYGGKVFAEVEIAGSPKIAALRPNVMSIAESPRECAVEKSDVSGIEAKSKVVNKQVETDGKIELTEAEVIVSGGRGTSGNFAPLEELAAELNAALGASRSAVDEGWRPHSDQVGQTGKTVSPNLYVACGISGAIQHLAGMSSSKYILAINSDPEAPIFSKADFGIVGDLFEVAPALVEEIKKRK